MKKLYYLGLLSLCLLSLAACREEVPTPWIPELEETGFAYFKDTVAEARRGVNQAAADLRGGDTGRASLELKKVDQVLLKTEKYFLPMTEVRQLIYDADRLYYLGRKVATKKNLLQARALLIRVGEAGGGSVEKAVSEAIVMIEDLERIMDMEPRAVPEKMRLLGEKINLMVLKGDLVLAGATYPPGN